MKNLENNPAERLLRQFWEGYNKRDLTYIRNLCLPNVKILGPTVDDCLVGLKEVEAKFGLLWCQSEKFSIDVINCLPGSSDALWTAALCTAKFTVKNQEHILENFRCTLAIEKQDDTWKIAHVHASFPRIRTSEINI
ncbi:ketosteroid isomerase-like protein [Oxalobacteraceae bacterium GrIS 2.11]